MANAFLIQEQDKIKTYEATGKESTVYDFTANEKGLFEENEHIVFDGSAKMKTDYLLQMQTDTSFAGTGTLLRSPIQKSDFKVIEKVEVN